MDIMIVDDEPLARERLARMVEQIDGCSVVAVAGNGEEALGAAETHQPELVLMDVRMPGMDGLAAAQYLAQFDPPPAVIFCTAYDDYAVEAFSSQAMGYLLKPVKKLELERAVGRCKRVNKAQLAELQYLSEDGDDKREYVVAKNRRGVDLIPVNNVRVFQADHKYVTAYHTEGEALLDETLKDLENQFADDFVRVHRNALVSTRDILGLERNSEGQYFVKLDGIDIRPQVSRRHASLLKKLLEEL
ncbi:MAG: LytR/AlgR family response regulator transcription factor [bacterium]